MPSSFGNHTLPLVIRSNSVTHLKPSSSSQTQLYNFNHMCSTTQSEAGFLSRFLTIGLLRELSTKSNLYPERKTRTRIQLHTELQPDHCMVLEWSGIVSGKKKISKELRIRQQMILTYWQKFLQ
jgi:hypothetical protein